ncbi:MAG: AI-2E family transporter [Pirellulales bacterium]
MKNSRLVTFVILLLILAFFGILFYRVISGFLLPLFLAAILTVVFGPFHQWVLARCGGRRTLAAIATTLAILLVVLGPLALIVALAIHEGNELLVRQRGDLLGQLKSQVAKVSDEYGLHRPFFAEFELTRRPADRLESLINSDRWDDSTRAAVAVEFHALAQPCQKLADGIQAVDRYLQDLKKANVSWPDAFHSPLIGQQHGVEVPARILSSEWGLAELQGTARLDAEGETQLRLDQLGELYTTLNESAVRLESPESAMDYELPDRLSDQISLARLALVNLNTELRGGPIRAWASDLISPGESQYRVLETQVRTFLQRWLPAVTGQATALIGSLIVGAAIMTISLFYFFLDGPSMVRSLMALSPLDDVYEQQLLEEFDRVSRAVVGATLLSALAQGVLAGFGYFLVGAQSVFLLTFMTIIMALVPFVGAAAVWIPICIWLVVAEGRWPAAAMLAIWGVVVVSMVDNVLKPMLLHGQSKLHPLLALLSVLGGVQALGPIGILVGPMVVSILQAVLNMVNKELTQMKLNPHSPAGESSTSLLALPATVSGLPTTGPAATGPPATGPPATGDSASGPASS